MLRLGVSDIPAWQILSSIWVLSLSEIAGMLVSIKIYNRHMCCMGKNQAWLI